MSTKEDKTAHIKRYCFECNKPHTIDNTSIDNWMEGVCSDKCLLETKKENDKQWIAKEDEIKFNKDCPGWDVDASEDGQFIVNCEHKECDKE